MIEPIRVCIVSEHYMSTRIWFQVSFVWENSALRIILHQNMTFYSIRFMTGPLISSDTSRLFFLGKWHMAKMILGILRAKSVENRDVSRHPEKIFKGHRVLKLLKLESIQRARSKNNNFSQLYFKHKMDNLNAIFKPMKA